VPVFISIDPERDTVEQIREYLKGNFDFSTTHFALYSLCVDSLMM
jgi:cytochrome oxidase Cu insertion factor (SCO1/SenC/PrrC family)